MIIVFLPIPPNSSLRQLIHGPIPKSKLNSSLATIIDNNKWNFTTLSFELPPQLTLRINHIALDRMPYAIDTPYWHPTPSEFTASSAYQQITNIAHIHINNFPHKWQWSLPTTNKLKYFLWLLLHQRLPTTSFPYARKIAPTTNCNICHYS